MVSAENTCSTMRSAFVQTPRRQNPACRRRRAFYAFVIDCVTLVV